MYCKLQDSKKLKKKEFWLEESRESLKKRKKNWHMSHSWVAEETGNHSAITQGMWARVPRSLSPAIRRLPFASSSVYQPLASSLACPSFDSAYYSGSNPSNLSFLSTPQPTQSSPTPFLKHLTQALVYTTPYLLHFVGKLQTRTDWSHCRLKAQPAPQLGPQRRGCL